MIAINCNMPSCCQDCPCCDDYARCGITGKWFGDVDDFDSSEGRMPDCQLIEPPDCESCDKTIALVMGNMSKRIHELETELKDYETKGDDE